MQTRPLTDSARTRRGIRFPGTTAVFSCASLALAALALLAPHEAFADPHAVFYTDTGQKQVFFNVLAALNQADYVEVPGTPTIAPIKTIGDELVGAGERVTLPRIRVRQVTSDDGDVFYREELWRRNDEVAAKTNVSVTECAILRLLLGEIEASKSCPETPGQ